MDTGGTGQKGPSNAEDYPAVMRLHVWAQSVSTLIRVHVCECTCVQQAVWGTPVVICALLSDEGIRE